MFGVMPLRAAYGRTYKSAKAVRVDWESGKDFVTMSGQYANNASFPAGTMVTIRYNNDRSVTVVKSKGGVQ